MRIGTLGIVGAGAMGRGIAQVAAAGGLEVRLHDAHGEAAKEAERFIASMLERQVAKGRMSGSHREAALARIEIVQDLAGMAPCDAVIEAIIEDLEAKRQLFRDLEAIVAETAILATNTSSLSVAAIAAACRRPERVAGFHFFNPVPLMRVVEVVPGLRTDPAVADALTALARAIGHTPVRASDSPGFLVNHAGRGYGTEALRILQEGVAAPAEIDRVLREAAGFPMGPFELLDLTGLDVSDAVMRSIYHQFYEEPRFRPSPLTRQRVAAGLHGRKTGEGWYRYEGGRRQEPEEPDEPVDQADPRVPVWLSPAEPEGAALAELLARSGAVVEPADSASADALCIVTPFGQDATTAALEQGLDPRRTVAVDPLQGFERRLTLMANPLTTGAMRRAAHGLLTATGRPVTAIADSPGFIAQRVLATVVNVAAEIAQQRIAEPLAIDMGVRLGLGYPRGPLAWGDELGPARILRILEGLQALTGDPRYRPSAWLRRRARLGVSLLTPDLAE